MNDPGMRSAMDSPWFHLERTGRTLRPTAGGPWTVYHASALDSGLRAIKPEGATLAEIDARGVANYAWPLKSRRWREQPPNARR